jgi:hypothetical protein
MAAGGDEYQTTIDRMPFQLQSLHFLQSRRLPHLPEDVAKGRE